MNRLKWLTLGFLLGAAALYSAQHLRELIASPTAPLFFGSQIDIKRSGDVNLVVHADSDAVTPNLKILEVKTGNASPVTRFSVDEDGDLYTAGSLGIGSASPAATLDVGGASLTSTFQHRATWGLNARTQGMLIFPEGTVTDDGAGNLNFGSTVIVMNPASGSYIRVASGTYALGSWGYLYVDVPPTGTRGTTVAPTVGAWSDLDRAYDSKDRVVLAQREGAGDIFCNFDPPANALTRLTDGSNADSMHSHSAGSANASQFKQVETTITATSSGSPQTLLTITGSGVLYGLWAEATTSSDTGGNSDYVYVEVTLDGVKLNSNWISAAYAKSTAIQYRTERGWGKGLYHNIDPTVTEWFFYQYNSEDGVQTDYDNYASTAGMPLGFKNSILIRSYRSNSYPTVSSGVVKIAYGQD